MLHRFQEWGANGRLNPEWEAALVHDSEIADQRCQMICPASSGTEELGWWGMMRAV